MARSWLQCQRTPVKVQTPVVNDYQQQQLQTRVMIINQCNGSRNPRTVG